EAALHTALGTADSLGANPRVHVSADFRLPLRFNDEVDVQLAVASIGRASLRYLVTVESDAGVAAEAEVTVCHVDRETPRAAPWPADVRELLATAGPQGAGGSQR